MVYGRLGPFAPKLDVCCLGASGGQVEILTVSNAGRFTSVVSRTQSMRRELDF
jgi:hypothetical protein